MQHFILHAGGHEATIDQVDAVKCPANTDSHFPIPHTALIERTTDALDGIGLKPVSQQFGLWKDGLRFFGVIELKTDREDYSTIVGLRNSHDKAFAASLACGSRVFVCDNLAFGGEIIVGRKHTTNIMRDLERLVVDAIGKLNEHKVIQEERMDAYHEKKVSNNQADVLIMQAFRSRMINVQRIAQVNKNWRDPEHEEFEPRNVYSLFNAFTSAMVGNVMMTANNTPGLHGMMDTFCGIKAAA